MKKLNRPLALALMLLLAVSLLAGCGSAPEESPAPSVSPAPSAAVQPEPGTQPETVPEPEPAEELGEYIPGGRNVRAADYDTGGYLQFAGKAQWIGELSGSWYDMGKAIGEAAGEMIAASTDYWWEQMCQGRGVEATVEAMDKYAYQIDALDPTQTELLEGMVEGAKAELDSARYGDPSNPDYAEHFDRVLAASIFDCWLWGDPDSYQSDAAGANGAAESYISGNGCNSVAVKGSATVDGSTISSQVRHTEQAGLCYQASMTYSGEDSNKVWTVGNVPTANGLLLVNDKGVSISHHFGGATSEASMSYEGGPYYGGAYGVPWPNALFYAAKNASSAKEAIDLLVHGSERYREITGRSTMLRDGTWNWMVCDEETLAVLEISPDRYAVRYAGEYTGEDWTDPDYIVCANHFQCTYSYDENDNKTDVPMTIYNVNETSEDRFWTLMWEMKDHKGEIDTYMLQHIFSQTYLRDRETGEYIYAQPDESGKWVPTGFVNACAQGTLQDGGLAAGTNAAKLAVLNGDSSVCFFCLGNPMDWEGEWDRYLFAP